MKILNGIVQKQAERDMLSRASKDDKELRRLRNNLIISGLDEDNEETRTTTSEVVTDFFSQTLKIPSSISIQSAERKGKANPRTIKIKLKDGKDKKTVFEHTKNLKDVRNNADGKIYVNSQLPLVYQELRRKYRYYMSFNKHLTRVGKCNLSVKQGEFRIDGQKHKFPIHHPSVTEMMYPPDEQGR